MLYEHKSCFGPIGRLHKISLDICQIESIQFVIKSEQVFSTQFFHFCENQNGHLYPLFKVFFLIFPCFSIEINQTSFFFPSQLLASKNIFPSEIVQKCFSTSDGKIFLDPKIFFRQTYLSDVLALATFQYINQVQVRLMEKYFWIQKYFSKFFEICSEPHDLARIQMKRKFHGVYFKKHLVISLEKVKSERKNTVLVFNSSNWEYLLFVNLQKKP